MAAFMRLREQKHYKNRIHINANNSKQLLRFKNDSVYFIANYFLGEQNETRGGALNSRQKIEIFLRYISDPGFQSGVAHDLGVERTTVCKTFASVLDSIVDKAHHWIKFPITAEEIEEAKRDWNSVFRIPTVIGALDCTHIEIKKPKYFKEEYVNRKGRTTINVQATCDAYERITSIDAQWPGSVHDSRIWRQSDIQQTLRQYDGSASLLGDSGYGISPWLITPYSPIRNAGERQYNKIHAQERVIIERVFGQLKQRFPILGNRVRLSTDKIPKVILSCAVLHNISKHLNDGWAFDNFEENEDLNENQDPVEIDNVDMNEIRIRRRGQQKRDQIAHLLLN